MSRLDRRLAALEAKLSAASRAVKPQLAANVCIRWMLATPAASAAIDKLRAAEGYGVDPAKASRLRAAAQRSLVGLARKQGETEIAESLDQG